MLISLSFLYIFYILCLLRRKVIVDYEIKIQIGLKFMKIT